ncbi:hypothetical protein C8J57DRAFT_1585978 [Mycena rebaudengoi]|nr:hypothetical protein C8J57DRAFT_1585978 [Mycena rebaudengoi]
MLRHTFPPSPHATPLTRQQTLGSLRSWWSDSNPNLHGPTINLHTVAKLLMKVLYDRQAMEFIENNRGTPLSAMTGEIYGSYLSCKYVSAAMKTAIVSDIFWRVYHGHEALEMHSNMIYDLIQLLEAPATVDRIPLRHILKALAKREASTGALVSTLCDSLSRVPQVVEEVLWALSYTHPIKFPPVTSGISVEAKLLDCLSDMLENSSTTASHRLYILRIISNLTLNKSTAIAVVEANVLDSVGRLLRSRPADLYRHIFSMLENLASHECTATAVVRMIPFDLLEALWRKSVDDIAPVDVLATRWEDLVTAKLLDSPRNSIAEATCGSLVALVCDSNMPQVANGALWALSRVPHLKFPPATAGVSVQAKLLDHIVDMLEAPNTAKWRYPLIFQILSHLALNDESGAVAVVEANVLNSAEKLLRSSPADLYQHVFPVLDSLASHESTAMAVFHILPFDLLGACLQFTNSSSKCVDDTDVLATWWGFLVTTKLLDAPRKATAEATCGSLVALICNSDRPQVADGALWALSRVPHLNFPPVTTRLSVEANLLAHIEGMLETPNTTIWRYPVIFQILSHLAFHHESSAVAIVETNVLSSVEKLLQSRTTDLYEHIFPMLESLASHESTATTVLDMHLYDLLVALWRKHFNFDDFRPSLAINVGGLHSFNSEIELSTYRLLQALVGHEATVHAVLAIVPLQDIIALTCYGFLCSSNEDYEVHELVIETLQLLGDTLRRLGRNDRKQRARLVASSSI